MMLTCGWLFTWVYELPPNIWLSEEAMMNPLLFGSSQVLGLILAFAFVYVYHVFYKGIPGKGAKKGMIFGALIWLVTALGMITMPFYMTIATTVVVYWIIQNLVLKVITGAIVGAIYKP